VGALGRHTRAVGVAVGAAVLAAGAIGYQAMRSSNARPSAAQPAPTAPFASAEFTKLVAAGETVAAAISPDGKLIARAVSDERGQSLWTRQVATLAGLQIVPPAKASYVGVTFAPSGEYVYYALKPPGTKATLYKVPALGGEATKVIEDVAGAVAFSPDGKRIAFAREDVGTGTSSLVVSDADGGGERIVSTKRLPLRWFTTPGSPAWSPDGTKIACGLGDLSAREDACSVVEVPTDGGEERRITPPHPEWWIVGQVAWMPDGRGLVAGVAEAAPSGPRWQIVTIAYPGGDVRRVTNDTHHYVWASLTKDGGKLLAVELTFRSAIWSFERGDAKRGRQLTFGEGDEISGLACGPDGRLVFADVANSIWVADEDGSNPRLLTGDDHTSRLPCFTPHGSAIVVNSWRDGPPALWRMDVDGGNVVRLTSGSDDDVPRCSPDGWVYFTSTTRSGSPALYKVSLEGGPVVLASAEPVVRGVPSPDGRWIACVLQRPNGQASLAVMPADGGAMRPLADPGGDTVVRWRRDGKALSYAVGGQVWEKPLDAGPAKRLMMLDEGVIYEFDWSPDGTRLVAALGKQETSLVIIGALK
jgi:Tol biopolymer transport system component